MVKETQVALSSKTGWQIYLKNNANKVYVKCAIEYNWTEQSINDIKISPTNYFQGGGNFITMPNIRIKIFSDVRIIEFYEVSHTSEDLRTFLQWIQHIIKYTKNSRCTGYLFEMDNSIILQMGNSLFPRQSKKPDKVGRFCLDILYLRGRRILFRNLNFYLLYSTENTSFQLLCFFQGMETLAWEKEKK